MFKHLIFVCMIECVPVELTEPLIFETLEQCHDPALHYSKHRDVAEIFAEVFKDEMEDGDTLKFTTDFECIPYEPGEMT